MTGFSTKRSDRALIVVLLIPLGLYTVTVTLSDGRSWSAEAEIEPGRKTDVDLLPRTSASAIDPR